MEFNGSKNFGKSTLMERIFRQCQIPEGIILSDKIPSLLQSIYPQLSVDEKELQRLIAEYDNGSGTLDFDSITKIIFNLFLKQSADNFYHEKDDGEDKLTLDDFIIFNGL